MKGLVHLMHLVPLAGGAPIAIDKPILFFGRLPECDVVLLNSRKVSRKHCCIAQIDDHFVIRDLGSMNGVRVNGKVVKGECRVGAGDEILIGDIAFQLEIRVQEKKADKKAVRKPASRPSPAHRPVSDNPAAKHPRRVDPKFLSQDLPVALPEEDVDFSVEETHRRSSPVSRKNALSDDDVLDVEDIDIIEE